MCFFSALRSCMYTNYWRFSHSVPLLNLQTKVNFGHSLSRTLGQYHDNCDVWTFSLSDYTLLEKILPNEFFAEKRSIAQTFIIMQAAIMALSRCVPAFNLKIFGEKAASNFSCSSVKHLSNMFNSNSGINYKTNIKLSVVHKHHYHLQYETTNHNSITLQKLLPVYA